MSPSFSTIIDADHAFINRLAGLIRRTLTPNPSSTPRTPDTQSTLHTLLLEITTRLVRHDFAEARVMRPAFIAHFGAVEGGAMARRDEEDHENGRRALRAALGLLGLRSDSTSASASACPSSLTAATSVGLSDGDDHRKEGVLDENTKQTIGDVVLPIFDELAEHMRVESGEFIPRFEAEIETVVSRRLAREYADALVVVPDVTLRCEEGEGKSSAKRRRAFEGGREEYIDASMERLMEVYESLLRERKVDSTYFDEMKRRELSMLKISTKDARL